MSVIVCKCERCQELLSRLEPDPFILDDAAAALGRLAARAERGAPHTDEAKEAVRRDTRAVMRALLFKESRA